MKVEFTCLYCKVQFISDHYRPMKFCSRVCKDTNQKLGLVKNCLNCSKEFYAALGQLRVPGYAKFCSNACTTTYNGRSADVCRNKRLGAIKRIRNSKGQCFPSYNRNAISILISEANKLEIEDLQHAENGGEFYLDSLGYWVDGYSRSKNIVIEYYERYHYKDGALRERELRRENEIKETLKCSFVRIKYDGTVTIH